MDELIAKLLEQSPAMGAIIAIVWIGMKWHERIATQWLSAIDKIDERNNEASQRFVDAVKEIGEKCHDAHHKVSQMFYEQSCKGQEVLMHVSMNMANFARAQEELTHAVRELRRQ